jgi:hypothetical protein
MCSKIKIFVQRIHFCLRSRRVHINIMLKEKHFHWDQCKSERVFHSVIVKVVRKMLVYATPHGHHATYTCNIMPHVVEPLLTLCPTLGATFNSRPHVVEPLLTVFVFVNCLFT